jgi:peroxiredoxin family protein
MSTTTAVPAPAIVPSFDDTGQEGRTLAIICSKGSLDMAYPGLIIANAALGEGVETHLFFTFWGFDIITRSTMADLKMTMLGNPATHLPQGLGGLPGMTHLATSRLRTFPMSRSSSTRSSTRAVTSGRAGCQRT